jgi:hypothetical protein
VPLSDEAVCAESDSNVWCKKVSLEAVNSKNAFARLVWSGEDIVVDGAQASAGAAEVGRAEMRTGLHRNRDSTTHLIEESSQKGGLY